MRVHRFILSRPVREREEGQKHSLRMPTWFPRGSELSMEFSLCLQVDAGAVVILIIDF